MEVLGGVYHACIIKWKIILMVFKRNYLINFSVTYSGAIKRPSSLSTHSHHRHEKVQENCIDLVGRIADRGAEYVSAREWMRICFELLELIKAHKKAIRRATVNTFGYIAKAIGPHDVLATLLNNLKVCIIVIIAFCLA